MFLIIYGCCSGHWPCFPHPETSYVQSVIDLSDSDGFYEGVGGPTVAAAAHPAGYGAAYAGRGSLPRVYGQLPQPQVVPSRQQRSGAWPTGAALRGSLLLHSFTMAFPT